MYYFIEPPYLLLVFGLFIGVTSGLAFEAVLKEKGQKWFRNGSSEKILDEVQSLDIKLPFWGICAGICVFLIQVLLQLREGGSESIDLDIID
jgi:hypothetical protein